MDKHHILWTEPVFWSRIGFAEDPTKYDEHGNILFKDEEWADYIAEHRAFFKAGVRIHTSILHNGWVGVDRYDYRGVDRTLQAICSISPEILYMPRIKLNAPAEWCLQNPEEIYLSQQSPREVEEIKKVFQAQLPHFSTGGLAWDYDDRGCAVGLQSFCSEKWLQDAAHALEKLLEHIESGPYAKQIVGYHIGFGMCAENAVWGGWVAPRRFGDFGICAAKKFEAYCKAKYGTTEEAAQRFGIQYIGDPVCLIPSIEKRCHTPASLQDYFRNDDEQSIMYARFLSSITADAICYFAKSVKLITNKPVGAFYSYLFSSYPAQIGHLAIQKLIDCQDVDFLSSPKMYYRSNPGQPGGAQGMSCSVQRKKLWMDELDNGTHIGRHIHRDEFYPACLEETRTVLWREVCKNLSWNNQNFWWMDLGGRWYNDERVMELFPPLMDFIRKMRYIPRKSITEILFVVDEESLYYQNEDSHMMGGHHTGIVNEMAAELLLCGAPVEQYRLCDLMELDLKKYRMIVFANAFCVDEKMRAHLKNHLSPETLCIWHYAAGIRRPEYALENVQDLTGMAIAPYSADFSVNNGYDVEVKLPPIQILPGEKVEVLKQYTDGAIQTARKGNHLLCASMDFRAKNFADLAEKAGCRMYAPAPCAVYGDNRFLGFFPAEDQEGRLDLGENGVHEELISKSRYTQDFISMHLKAKDGMVFVRV